MSVLMQGSSKSCSPAALLSIDPVLLSAQSDSIDASQITRHVFLGSYERGACARNGLRVLNITYNLMLGDAKTMPLPFADDPQIKYKFIQLPDHHRANIGQFFSECIDFIQEAISYNANILVNCWAGVSRSATVVMAFLVQRYCMSYMEAYETVRKARPIANPNAGFRQTLVAWSISHGRPVAASLLAKYDEARLLMRKAYLQDPPGLHFKDLNKVHEAFTAVFGRYHVHTTDLQDELMFAD